MSGTVREAHIGGLARFLRGFAWCLVHTVQRPKLSGVKPPLDEPTIFACSHVGLMDPVILMVSYLPYMIRPLIAKDYYEKNKFTRSFYKIAQCIPIDRRKVSTKWMEDSLAALAKGEHIIIYPEGKRNKSGQGLLPFHSGVKRGPDRPGVQFHVAFSAPVPAGHRGALPAGDASAGRSLGLAQRADRADPGEGRCADTV